VPLYPTGNRFRPAKNSSLHLPFIYQEDKSPEGIEKHGISNLKRGSAP
jgi:hypothetical protein